jgi:molybdopterin-containing oxidoreductase family membrane subunit
VAPVEPAIEIPLSLGTLSLFILLYMAASRLIPLVPVWEVQEGQMAHSVKKFGRETVVTVSELE